MSNLERDIILSSKTLFKEIGTVIVCFSTGVDIYEHMEPLSRKPTPKTGWELGNDFESKFREALSLNPAIHDGALAFNRLNTSKPYTLKAWSCRLFPPFTDYEDIPNKGVAWNSCLSASRAKYMDKIFLFSSGKYIEFVAGKHNSLS